VATPLATPVITPELFTVATAVLLLLHVPPAGVAVTVVVAPAHTVDGVLVITAEPVTAIVRDA